MERTTKHRNFRWTDWLLTAATLLTAALLILGCLDVYRIGTSPENLTAAGVRLHDVYSRADVVARLSAMSWAFWLMLAALALAIVWRHVSPLNAVKPSLSPDAQLELLLLHRSVTPAMEKEKRVRRVAACVCGGVCLLCAVFAAVYLLNPTTFASTDLETVMAAMVWHTLPALLVAFAALAALAQVRRASLLREIASAKQAPVCKSVPTVPARKVRTPYWRAALYVIAVGLLVAGVLNGGMYDVLVKAVNICTECIGLG